MGQQVPGEQHRKLLEMHIVISSGTDLAGGLRQHVAINLSSNRYWGNTVTQMSDIT